MLLRQHEGSQRLMQSLCQGEFGILFSYTFQAGIQYLCVCVRNSFCSGIFVCVPAPPRGSF